MGGIEKTVFHLSMFGSLLFFVSFIPDNGNCWQMIFYLFYLIADVIEIESILIHGYMRIF